MVCKKVAGETHEGVHLTMDFDVADVSRPLLSITEIIQKQRHRVVYDFPVSYIEDKTTGRNVNLRSDDNLYFLDVWVRIPKALASSPFFSGRLLDLYERRHIRMPMSS